MLTTFARIAKILKGLVEPRNWVEEAFQSVKAKWTDFHITVTDFTATVSDGQAIIRTSGDANIELFQTLRQLGNGAKGYITFASGEETKTYPVKVADSGAKRIGLVCLSPVFMEVTGDSSLSYEAIRGNIGETNGTCYVFSYTIPRETE